MLNSWVFRRNDLIPEFANDGPWIGYNDVKMEGNFVWSDGSPHRYENWDENEHNDRGRVENCVLFVEDKVWYLPKRFLRRGKSKHSVRQMGWYGVWRKTEFHLQDGTCGVNGKNSNWNCYDQMKLLWPNMLKLWIRIEHKIKFAFHFQIFLPRSGLLSMTN